MPDLADAEDTVDQQLVDWLEDVIDGIGPRCVVTSSPADWGMSTTLARFATKTRTDDDLALVVEIDGRTCDSSAATQVAQIAAALDEAASAPSVPSRLGLRTWQGRFQFAIGAADAVGAFSPIPAGSLIAFAVSIGMDLWSRDDADERAITAAEALGRRMARFSIDQLPLVVIVDHADHLDPRILNRLARGAADIDSAKVLLIVAVQPDADLPAIVKSPPGTPRTFATIACSTHEVDRHRLACSLLPTWPAAALTHLATRTSTFGQIHRVASADSASDVVEAIDVTEAVDSIVDALPSKPPPSDVAVVVAWAGGALLADQLDAAAQVLGIAAAVDDQVLPTGAVIRLTDRSQVERIAAVAPARFSRATLRRVATAITDRCTTVAGTDRLEQIVALRAVDVIAAAGPYLDTDAVVLGHQVSLSELLESIGELGAARAVIERAIAARIDGTELDPKLAARMLRQRTRLRGSPTASVPPGAVTTLEGRVWSTVGSLRDPDDVQQALAAIPALASELDVLDGSGLVDEWRLALGRQLAAIGAVDRAAAIVGPILADTDHAAHLVARAIIENGAACEDVIERAVLQDRLGRLDESDDDARMSLLEQIALLSHVLGDATSALATSSTLLTLQERVLGDHHHSTLTTRGNLAGFIGMCGDSRGALELAHAVLPDAIAVFGPMHREVLILRNNMAEWVGVDDPSAAYDMLLELEPAFEEVVGTHERTTLNLRHNLAAWAGMSGRIDEAVRRYTRLAADCANALGGQDLDTLNARRGLAVWTKTHGDIAAALAIGQPVVAGLTERLGTKHPRTLAMRREVAEWIGLSGNDHTAIALLRDVAADYTVVLGSDHPETMKARHVLAVALVRNDDDVDAALSEIQSVVEDRERVLGTDHKDALSSRHVLSTALSNAGRHDEAVQVAQDVIDRRGTDEETASTLATRANLVILTAETDMERALVDAAELLPSFEAVNGAESAETLSFRADIAEWMAQTGDVTGALELFAHLYELSMRVLGPTATATVKVRKRVVSWATDLGSHRDAFALSSHLLEDIAPITDEADRDLLTLRINVAALSGLVIEPAEGIRRLREVILDLDRLLPPDDALAAAAQANLDQFLGEATDDSK